MLFTCFSWTGDSGVIFNNGPSWREMRQFSLTNMRDFGMGKKASEEKIIEESQRLTEVFKEHKGKAFDPAQSVNNAVSNIICSIVYGSRFEYDDPVFISMVERVNKHSTLLGAPATQLYNFFPRLFSWLDVRKKMKQNISLNLSQIKKLIKDSQDTLNPQMCRGVVDSFLSHKMQLEESGNITSHFNEDNLLVTVNNLFSAGTDTTSKSIRFGLLLMAKYPKIQDRVQEEMNSVVGSRQVRVEDRKNLPYTDAVIHEIQRLADTVPLTIRRTTRDVVFKDYFIKKVEKLLRKENHGLCFDKS